MKRKTVKELVKDNEMRILKNKQLKEEYEKRKEMIKQNLIYWKKRFELYQQLHQSSGNSINSFISQNRIELESLGVHSSKELSSLFQNINYNQNIIKRIEYCKKDIDISFIDVICTNCYEMIRFDKMDEHSLQCSISTKSSFNSNSQSISFDDCNNRMYKMYSSLKEKSNDIESTHNSTLIKYYNTLLNLTYEILINNNSYEELTNDKKSLSMLVNFKFESSYPNLQMILNIFCMRLEQLVDIKINALIRISTKGNENESFKMCRISNVDSEVDKRSIKVSYIMLIV